MALSKLRLSHLKSLNPSPNLAAVRFLSFATPADAADERRRRKARLGMDPPLATLRHLQPPPPHNQRPRPPSTPKNPSIPKLPEPHFALSAGRLVLHNSILSLLHKDNDADLSEADLLVRHSIYSNCRPTIFTCNAVLSELLRRSRLADLLALHRFVIQAGIAPNVATYNLVLQAYCNRGAIDTALQNYRVFLRNSPLTPSPTTYRILVKALVGQSQARLHDAVLLKDDMTAKAFCLPDPTIYHLLMSGFIANGNADRAFALYEELKEKLGGGPVEDGIIYGSLMKAYFMKGMEKEAMDCHHEVLAQGSKVRFNEGSYNSVLEALSLNGKFYEALLLLDRMIGVHRPPQRLAVNIGSFNILVDGYCAHGRMHDAIVLFGKIGESKCIPDTASYNNLMEHLAKNQMAAETEELYMEMGERGINPDEFTYVVLMEACFGVGRVDDATGYFNKMIELGLRPNTIEYNKAIGGLVNVGRLDEAKGFFDMMVDKQVKPDLSSYEMLLQPFCEAGRLDDALKIGKGILMDEGLLLRVEMKELMNIALKKEMRENDLLKLYADVEREKAEALARAIEEKARAEALAREEAAKKEEATRYAIMGMCNRSASNEERSEGNNEEISDGVTMKKRQMTVAPMTKQRLEMFLPIGKP